MLTFKKYLFWGALGLFAYMPFHIFLSQWFSTFTGGLDAWKIAKDVFTAALVSVLVITVILSRKRTKLYLWVFGFSIVYLALHFLLWATTNQPTDTGLLATVYNNRLIWYLLIGYSLVLLKPQKLSAQVFVKALIVASSLVCLIGLLQWLLPKDIMTHFGYSIERGVKPNFFIDDKPDLPRVFSTIRDPNSLGAFLILPIAILAEALIRNWRTQRRLLISGLLLLHSLILFLTFSRSALLGTLLALSVLGGIKYGYLVKKYIRKLAVPAVIVLVALIGGAFLLRDQYIVQNVIFHSDESTALDDPNEKRVKLVQQGFKGVIDDPEGHGPGTAGLVSTKLPNGLLTENYYLQIGYEIGVIGLILFLGFLMVVLLRLWEHRNNRLDQVLIASFVGLAFMNLLLHTWANEAVAISWFMLSGVSLISISKKKRKVN